MLVGAIAGLDLGKLQRMTYPTDHQGRHCTLDNANYNYLYFTSTTDPVALHSCSQKDSVCSSARKEQKRGSTAGRPKIYRAAKTQILSLKSPYTPHNLPPLLLDFSVKLLIQP